jgi:hypothetical protein
VIFVMLCIHGIIVCGDVKSIVLLDDDFTKSWFILVSVFTYLSLAVCSVVMSSL